MITVDAPLSERADGESVLVFDDRNVLLATIEPADDCQVREVGE
ncbi:MAG TPA: hypothetical protein VJX23_02980 [Candidatus Binataceae bacterium]|nr:hypothetical protein [Candidatus Binataceae bacterium]